MTGKDFVVGDQLGLADIMLVSCLDWAVHYDFELQASLLRYRDLHRSRQAYRRAFDVNYRASS
jgi:glutathione S-transferase